jgi:uncharacterized protein (TIGR03435 family)
MLDLPGVPTPRPIVTNPGLPSYRDALRDQLGLELKSVRGPLGVLAIVSVHQPSEN